VSEHDRAADRRAGFTLVEVVGSTLLVTAVLSAAMHASADLASGSEAVRADLFVRVDRALARTAGDLKRGDLGPIPAAGDSISYQVPADCDGARTTIRLVTDRTISEAAQDFDLNGDGDRNDRFDLGHLELDRPDGTKEPLTGAWLLQPALNHGGDLDGDGVPDPIFSTDTTQPQTTATLDVTVAVKLSDTKWIVERKKKTILCGGDMH
jgi:hypothetical protein